MTPASPMQRKAVRRAVIAVRPIAAALAVRTVAALAVLRRRLLLLRLAAGDERRQPFDVAFVFGRHLLLRARLKVLRLRLILRLVLLRRLLRLLRLVLLRLIVLLRRVVLLRLMVLRLARIERLRLARRERFAGHGGLFVIAIVVAVIAEIAARVARLLLLVIGLALAKLFLRGGDQAKIMFGVLIIIFRGDRISGALRVAGELEIFFGDVGRRSPDFYVLPIGLVHSRQRILVVMMATLAITTAHAFVLTVSHGLLFRQPRYGRRHRCRRFCSPFSFTDCHSNSTASAARRWKSLPCDVTSPQQSTPRRRIRPRCRKPFVMRATVPQQCAPNR